MIAPWKSVTHVGDAEVQRLAEPQVRKHGPLVPIEYDAYVDVEGLRFWREAVGHGLSTVRGRRNGYGDEVWWFADGPVSVIVKDYGDDYAGASSHFCGWHGGRSYNLPSRERAFEAAVEGARERAQEQVNEAERELGEALRVLRAVTIRAQVTT